MCRSHLRRSVQTLVAVVFGALLLATPVFGALGDCSQPVTTGVAATASDCLFILRTAVGSAVCMPECVCDLNGGGGVTASDALVCLKNAVGQDIELNCPCTTLGHPALTPRLEEESASKLTIGPVGGEILARGFDGTRFRLVVPPGALSEPTEITVVPSYEVDGLPMEGGTHAAVELRPSGLSFAHAAMLLIAPSSSADVVVAGFSWSGAENAFSVAPALRTVADGPFAFEVTHFSGYGLGIPGPSELAALSNDLVALAAAEGGFGEAWTTLAREFILEGNEDLNAIADVLIQWHSQVVEPLLAVALDSPAEAIVAHHAAEAWLVHVAIFFGAGDPSTPAELASRRVQTLTAAISMLITHFTRYTRPACEADVPEWKDWLRVPEELRMAKLAYTEEDHWSMTSTWALPPERYCVSLELREPSFPSSIDEETTALPLSFTTVIALPDGTDLPIAGHVALTLGDGLTGDSAIDADASGQVSTVITRDPLGPRRAVVDAVATESEVSRPDLFTARDRFLAGTLEIYFAENFVPGPRPIVAPGEEVELCAFVSVGEPAGQLVEFLFSGEGTLSSHTALTTDALGVGQACVTYTAPEGYASRGMAFEIIAVVEHEGASLWDAILLYPAWVEIALEADVGTGRVNATNRAFSITTDGPFGVAAHVLTSGATTDDPPVPLTGHFLDVSAADEIIQSLSGYDAAVSRMTDDDGIARFVVGLAGSGASSHTVEVRTAGDELSSGVFVRFFRFHETPTLWVTMPMSMPGNHKAPVLVEALGDDGAPLGGHYVELTAVGGFVDAASGVTTLSTKARLDPESEQVTVSVMMWSERGGEFYGSAQVSGIRGPLGVAVLTGRREVVSTNGEGADGEIIGDGYVNACMPFQPGNCMEPGYGLRSYTASVGAFASVTQDLPGDSSTGLLEGSSDLDWASGDGWVSIHSQMRFQIGFAPLPWRVTLSTTGIGTAYVGRVTNGNNFVFIAFTSNQPGALEGFGVPSSSLDPDLFKDTGATVEATFYGEAGKAFVIVLSGGTESGSAHYELELGDDVPVEE